MALSEELLATDFYWIKRGEKFMKAMLEGSEKWYCGRQKNVSKSQLSFWSHFLYRIFNTQMH